MAKGRAGIFGTGRVCVKVAAKDIFPSQDYLKPETIEFIFDCLKNNQLDKLPPKPIVRKDEKGNFVAIDGHNLIAVKAYQVEDIDIHVAGSQDEGLPNNSQANTQRNEELKDKFDVVLESRKAVELVGIKTLQDLIYKYRKVFKEIK